MNDIEKKELEDIRILLDKARAELRILDFRLFEEKGLFKKPVKQYDLKRPRDILDEVDKRLRWTYYTEEEKGEYWIDKSGLF